MADHMPGSTPGSDAGTSGGGHREAFNQMETPASPAGGSPTEFEARTEPGRARGREAPQDLSNVHVGIRQPRFGGILPEAAVRVPWGVVQFDVSVDPVVTRFDADPNQAPPELLSVEGEVADLLLAPLRRLAVVEWLERWNPFLARPDVAELDLGMGSLEAGRRYQAFELFDRNSSLLLNLLAWQADRALPSALVAELRNCAASALSVLGGQHKASAHLRAALDLLQRSRDGMPIPAPVSLAEMERLYPRPRSLAGALGWEPRSPGLAAAVSSRFAAAPIEHLEQFDWFACHPRRSSLRGPDFRWTRHGTRISVELLSERVANRSGPLVVRVGGSRGEVLAEEPIAPARGSSVSLDSPMRWHDVVIEVAELRHRGALAIGSERARRAVGREATRGLMLARASAATQDLSPEAAEELEEAGAEALLSMQQMASSVTIEDTRRLARAAEQRVHTTSVGSRPTLSEYVAAAQAVGLVPP